ncbi:tyrosine protein phosphatase yvh1 [Gnomoniopsis sp. IMI 355080]|nr:tyrosine protein phosphatase yvh1 [Gnomoniopsis sp. IMI 355080]
MLSSNNSDSGRIQLQNALPITSIDIDDNATVSDSEDDDIEIERPRTRDSPGTNVEVTCLSPACCSRFEALTGLDLHAIKRELDAGNNNKHTLDEASIHSPTRAGAASIDHSHNRSVFEGGPDHKALHLLEQKAMALNRVDGPEELYVGGIFALRRPGAMEAKGVTHILSMIKYSFVDLQGFEERYVHNSVDVDDVDDEDIMVHLPRAVRFIERGLSGGSGEWPRGTVLPQSRSGGNANGEPKPNTEHPAALGRRPSLPESDMRELTLKDDTITDPNKPGVVFVHCAMGKSRSVTAVVAYLLWKYPQRYGLTPSNSVRPDQETAQAAVQAALDWVRKTRSIAEPNPGFMKQLEMWVMMGRPADTDDAVEHNGTYQRWLWEREVEESAKIGRKPDWLRFEDEAAAEDGQGKRDSQQDDGNADKELRCKKCRRVLATQQFIIPHQKHSLGPKPPPPCPHHFIEPLSWMRPLLEAGELDGRLVCPNPRCGSSLGRYSWKGFKCSCNEWVCPAFSLGASKVDQVSTRRAPGAGGGGLSEQGRTGLRPAPHGIRMPPGKQNL